MFGFKTIMVTILPDGRMDRRNAAAILRLVDKDFGNARVSWHRSRIHQAWQSLLLPKGTGSLDGGRGSQVRTRALIRWLATEWEPYERRKCRQTQTEEQTLVKKCPHGKQGRWKAEEITPICPQNEPRSPQSRPRVGATAECAARNLRTCRPVASSNAGQRRSGYLSWRWLP